MRSLLLELRDLELRTLTDPILHIWKADDEPMAEPVYKVVQTRVKQEVKLCRSALRDRRLWPHQAYVAGFLLLYLASWPWGLGQARMFDLPREPLFSFSQLLVLLAAGCLTLAASLTFHQVYQGRPYDRAQRVYRWQHPLWGILECWAGLLLILYMLLVLNGNAWSPGFLMGDRLGRLAFWVLPLLFRGAALTLAFQLPLRPARLLLDSSLLVMLLALYSAWYDPYVLLDGQFFGPRPHWEAVGFGVVFAGALGLVYCYGPRRRYLMLQGVGSAGLETARTDVGDQSGGTAASSSSEAVTGSEDKVFASSSSVVGVGSGNGAGPGYNAEAGRVDHAEVGRVDHAEVKVAGSTPSRTGPLGTTPQDDDEEEAPAFVKTDGRGDGSNDRRCDGKTDGSSEVLEDQEEEEEEEKEARLERFRKALALNYDRCTLRNTGVVLVLIGLLCLPPLLGAFLVPAPAPHRLTEDDLRLEYSDPLERSLWLGADWLLRDQNLDGSYRYMYALDNDTYLHLENIIRQAGTAYVMAYICAFTQDPDHCQAARRSMDFLTAQLEHDDTGAYILYHSRAVLGGTALSLVALAHYQLATGSTAYRREMQLMADHIMAQQHPNGSFDGLYKYFFFKGYDKHVSVYAGEALYALALMYRLYGDPAYQASYDLALPWYRDYWNDTHDTNLYAWAAKSGYHMYLATGEPRYAEYTFDMSDTIVSWQNLNPDSEGYGSYVGIVSINSGTYNEGVGDALYLAAALNDTDRVDRYHRAVNLSARSVAKLQVDRELAETGPRPLRSLGCFRSRMEDHILRIDYAQHALAAILRHLKWEAGAYQTQPDGATLQ